MANDVDRADGAITAHCQPELYPNVGLVASSITSTTEYFKHENINECFLHFLPRVINESMFSEL